MASRWCATTLASLLAALFLFLSVPASAGCAYSFEGTAPVPSPPAGPPCAAGVGCFDVASLFSPPCAPAVGCASLPGHVNVILPEDAGGLSFFLFNGPSLPCVPCPANTLPPDWSVAWFDAAGEHLRTDATPLAGETGTVPDDATRAVVSFVGPWVDVPFHFDIGCVFEP